MKIVHRYILTSFLKKFLPSFVIIYFIFVLQSFWLYFDELAGKGLGLSVIFKFLLYLSPFVVLNAIPLSILLGGIMSFGSLSERSEFTAMKSMGISLKQLIKAMSIPVLILAIATFIFANTALPYGNFKFGNLRRNIHNKMPSVAISEGVFNDFKSAGINIYVKKKFGQNKNKLQEIIIHQKVNGIPDKLIIAKSGLFKSDIDNQLIQLILYDGAFYEDLTRQQKSGADRLKYPAMKSAFKEHIINIDMSGMNKVDLNTTSISSAYHMLNVLDLNKQIDTIKDEIKVARRDFSHEFLLRNGLKNLKPETKTKIEAYKDVYALLNDSILIKKDVYRNVMNRAANKADGLMMFAKRKREYLARKAEKSNKYIHAFMEKFSYPISVIIMFLVGISLGTIIKKGGFGISVVFGIVIFVTYYILSMLGKNAAEEGAISPYLGAWFSTSVLLPLGIYLTYKANNDGEFIWISNISTRIKNFMIKILKIESLK